MRQRLFVYSGSIAILGFIAAGCGPATPATMQSGQDGGIDMQPTTVAAADPFIGSGGFGYAVGSAFVGAAAPQGLAKAGPDTYGKLWGAQRFLHCSGYWYDDEYIQGFSNLHMHGTGIPDYGVLGVMPVADFDPTKITKDKYQSTYTKSTESASPGYYGVTLDNGKIHSEMTATVHASHFRFTYPSTSTTGHLIVDLDHTLDVGTVSAADVTLSAADQTITGKLRSMGDMSGGFGGYEVYFVAKTKTPWTAQQVWMNGAAPADGTSASGTGVGFVLDFATGADAEPIEIQFGLSLVSNDNAAANLSAEMASFDFDGEKAAAAGVWNDLIDTIHVEGGTVGQRHIFLSMMHHLFLMPTIDSDVDGSYVGQDKKVANASGFHYVSDMSLWDTYRTLQPLYAIIAPDRALDSVRSLVAMAKASGYFSKWPLATGEAGTMIGASAEVVLADAYVKGLTDFDAIGAYSILRAAAMDTVTPAAGRGGRDDVLPYMALGYVPSTSDGKVSVTTEYAYDDFALSNLAAGLGKMDDAMALSLRSKGYQKLFDPGTGFLRGRLADGDLAYPQFDPTVFSNDYVEANGWQSVWYAAHDIDGLAALFGGRPQMIDKLTQFFENAKMEWDALGPNDEAEKALQRPYYWGGNEPDIQAGYMFAQAGRPDLTQKWVKWAMGALYGEGADGLPGNDDGGTMAAWYVFSAIGIYPLAGSDRYIVGAPLFPHVEIKTNGGVFTIDAPGVSDTNLYVQSAQLNGVALTTPELHHADLKAGGSLTFVMGPSAGTWGQ